MVCSHCQIFPGAPTCKSCQTYFRVGNLLQGGRLNAFQEAAVLSVLRECAGGLSDLVEGAVTGPYGPTSTGGLPGSGNGEDPEKGRWPIPRGGEERKSVPEEPSAKKEAGGSAPKPGGSGQRKGRDEKPKRDKRKKPRQPAGRERSPSERRTSESGRCEKERSTKDRERREERPRSEESVEEEDDCTDKRSAEELGLSRIPVRGSAGDQLRREGIIPAGKRPPPEPEHSPPRPRGSRGEDRTDRKESSEKGAMAPKAKVKAGAKGVPKAKGKVKAKAKGKGAAKGRAMRAMRGGLIAAKRAARPGRMRRPQGGVEAVLTREERLKLWEDGHSMMIKDVPMETLADGAHLVVEEAVYFHRQGKIAGHVIGTRNKDGDKYLEVEVRGTTLDNLLQWLTGALRQVVRLHVCPPGCSHEETSEDLLHAGRVRKQGDPGLEEAWIQNLEKAMPLQREDELEELRKRMPDGPARPGEAAKDKRESKEEKSKKSKKKKKKKADKKDKKDATKKESQPRSSNEAKSSSSSSTSGEETSKDDEEAFDGNLFAESTQVKAISDRFPGALAAQAQTTMRNSLLWGMGLEAEGTSHHGMAMQYVRQVIRGRASGPMLRELMTLAAGMDLLCAGKPAQCMDLLSQRFKATESNLAGSHWSVCQKLELLPPEQVLLAGHTELKTAQKNVWEETRTKHLASQPEGRPGQQKGGGKAKGIGKEDPRKSYEPRKGGKGQQRADTPEERALNSKLTDAPGDRTDERPSAEVSAVDLEPSEKMKPGPEGRPTKEITLRAQLEDGSSPQLGGSGTTVPEIRSIDYKGDEVRVARRFCWANITPALPSEVMVSEEDWPDVCRGLVAANVCVIIPEEEVFSTDQGPLLNGLFGVTKDEWADSGVEIFRLIMNLIPLNGICQPMKGDVDTLPSWGSMNPFFLQPSENLLISSEDVRCFFYTMSVPDCWIPFLAFNKVVPEGSVPDHLRGKRCYLASRVLPMGFLNSVSLAQHVHRNLVAWSNERSTHLSGDTLCPDAELRKDRPLSLANPAWRVYLDNFDLLEKVEATQLVETEGSVAPGVWALRSEYELWKVPRNMKKSVSRSTRCELQGATVDGVAGIAFPRESKLAKYLGLAFSLVRLERASQKQWQVVCGGLVYFTMFRRGLLSGLNNVWQHIESFNSGSSRVRQTPDDSRLEICRAMGLLPLARLDFRLDMHPMVTCSDASSTGGGICASVGLTHLGEEVSTGGLRGEANSGRDCNAVLSIGLFDGVGALRVALDALGVPVLGHISVEMQASAQRVVESNFPGSIMVSDVRDVDETMVRHWATQFSQCSLVLIGGGPPCQGVSGLNCDRRGALRDSRSNLFTHVPRIRELVRTAFPWCQVRSLMESVSSMDDVDRQVMTEGFGEEPVSCNAGDVLWCLRPRLYWFTWSIDEGNGFSYDDTGKVRVLHLDGSMPLREVVQSGWLKVEPHQPFPTFTTSRPRDHPGRKPAGVRSCDAAELQRWESDSYRFPPYQYKLCNSLVNSRNVKL
eukprot:Skav215497  [mRNA]  locus=scaffold165:781686:787326:- [translate_table: standard]